MAFVATKPGNGNHVITRATTFMAMRKVWKEGNALVVPGTHGTLLRIVHTFSDIYILLLFVVAAFMGAVLYWFVRYLHRPIAINIATKWSIKWWKEWPCTATILSLVKIDWTKIKYGVKRAPTVVCRLLNWEQRRVLTMVKRIVGNPQLYTCRTHSSISQITVNVCQRMYVRTYMTY